MKHSSLKRYVWLTLFIAQFMLSAQGTAQAPVNDECAGATVISSLPFSTSQNTRLATPNASDPLLSCNRDQNGNIGLNGKAVWFTYTAASSQDLSFSTLGSTPSTYDIVLGLFTGTCGALTEVACNDDAAGTRQSKIYHQVQAGTTYYIFVAEWNGGGTSGGVPTGGDLVFTAQVEAPPPLVRGPRSGSVSGGATISTDGFAKLLPFAPPGEQVIPNRPESPSLVTPKFVLPPKGPEGSNFVQDRLSAPQAVINRPVVVKDFPGIPRTNFIPPDPILAVGPNHVLAMVNSRFQIWDKNGTALKGIDLNSWFATVHPNAGFSDPQVIYDHFANRWVMAGIATDTSAILLSVSDDSNPLGVWYNWSLPGFKLGDSTTTNFNDYPQMGYDSLALYVTSREFTTSFQYCKVRIIPKAQLYANAAGPVTWNDFWDFKDPDNHQVAPDGLQPSIIFGNSGGHYLVNASPYVTGTFFTLWSITNPITTPSITAVNIPVVQFQSPPLADQLGGSSTRIDGGDRAIRSRAVYRDSSLWVAHAVASGPGNAYSGLHYVRINPFTRTNLEDVVMGLDNYWYYYPALMVDQNKNVFITYTRSGVSEYAGAYLSGRKNGDPAGLSPSVALKTGEANYVSVANGRNRWGDYNGIALDPADGKSVWSFTEYASSPANTWSTWVGQSQMGPLPGAYVEVSPAAAKDFGLREVSFPGDTLTVTISNNGTDTLVISNVFTSNSQFTVFSPVPVRIPTYGTGVVRVTFSAQVEGRSVDTLVIRSNALNRPVVQIPLSGKGTIIGRAQVGVMYASSSAPSSLLQTINPQSGAPTTVGGLGIADIQGLAIRPSTKELYGTLTTVGSTGIYRISTRTGDALLTKTIPLGNMRAIAFSLTGDTLYGATTTGRFYRINLTTGDTTFIGATASVVYSALAFSPTSGKLWASVRPPVSGKDRIYTVNTTTGLATLVGATTFNVVTAGIAFNALGTLYGLTGTGTQVSNLILIDTITAKGTTIGSTGLQGLSAIALRPDSLLTGVDDSRAGALPLTYALDQNYPNPFNPTTKIQLTIVNRQLSIVKVFDVLGQEVATLMNEVKEPGTYTVRFDASSLSSGVYFYRLRSGDFIQTKKMLLLK